MAKNCRNLNLLLFVGLLISGITFFIGCGGGGSGDDPLPAGAMKTLKITGNVSSLNGLSSLLGKNSPSIRAAIVASGAEVYLESDRSGHSTLTDGSGNFVLDNLPAGNHYVVARIKTASGKTYKVRSTQISVSDSQPVANISSMLLQEATNVITGHLKDVNGVGIPNAPITLWGETFFTDSNGAFTTPPMPSGVTANIIGKVTGYQSFTTSVSFNSASGQSIEQIMVPTSATNRAPSISLSATKYSVSPNEQISLTATAMDPDNDTLTYSWSKTAGVVGNSTSNSNTWTAPSSSAMATVSCTVADSNGLEASASVSIIVGNPNDTNYPPVVLSIDSSSTTFLNNTSYNLTANASDANGDALSYSWSAAQGTITPIDQRTVSWHTPNITGTQYVQVSVLVNDNRGGSVQKVATFTVSTNPNLPENHIPVVTISSPVQGSLLASGFITFSGSASDAEDGTIGDGSFVWYQAIEGQPPIKIGEKNHYISLSVTNPATYVVTLQVSDQLGAVGQATITYRINATPTATINSPANNSIFQLGSAVAFAGSGTDPEDGTISPASLSWLFPGPQLITGNNPSLNDLPPGTQTIQLTAYDRIGGVSDVKSINIYMNTNPEIVSISPASGSDYLQSDDVSFSLVASDPDGIILPTNVQWIDGATTMGFGNPLTIATLTSGVHTIVASVTDGMGGFISSTTSVVIAQRPTMTIVQPTDNQIVMAGSTLTFIGNGTSFFGAVASSTMIWEDFGVATNTLKTGASQFTKTYTVSELGKHIITLTGKDKYNVSSYTQHTIFVNATPTVTINSPASGTRFDLNANIMFKAAASDPDSSDALSVAWLDGATQIGTGKEFSTSTLASGDHNIFCQVTDSHGTVVNASISVLVNTLPVATITWSTPQYATAPGNLPVFISQNPSMSINFSAQTYDEELHDTIESYNSNNIKWFTNVGGSQSLVGTGKTLTTTLPIGVSTLTLKVYDTFYPEFEDQASFTVSIPVYVWQSKSYNYGSNGLASGPTFITGSSGLNPTLYISFDNPAPHVKKYTFHGDFGAEWLEEGDSYDLVSSYSFSMVTGVDVVNSRMTALGIATGAFTIASFTGTEAGDASTLYNPGGALNNSTALTSDGVRAYVSNAGDNKILMINPNTRTVSKSVSAANNINFSTPTSVRYSNSTFGKLFVADHDNNRIVRFGDNYLGSILSPIPVIKPCDIAFSQSYLFVTATSTNNISVFDPTNQSQLMQFGKFGSGDGEFNNPIRIFSSGYDLFVIDSGNNRIQVIRSGEADWFK